MTKATYRNKHFLWLGFQMVRVHHGRKHIGMVKGEGSWDLNSQLQAGSSESTLGPLSPNASFQWYNSL